MARLRLLAAVLAAASALGACSSDDSAAPSGAGGASPGSGGAAGGAGIQGSGGKAAGTGGVASGGLAAAGGSAPLRCGGAECAPKFTPPCCTATGTGVAGDPLELAGREPDRCGTDLGQYSAALTGICLELDQPGTLDPACPDVKSPTPGQPDQKGCCTDQGFCGAYEGALALGCYYSGAKGKPCGTARDGGADGAAPRDAAPPTDAADAH